MFHRKLCDALQLSTINHGTRGIRGKVKHNRARLWRDGGSHIGGGGVNPNPTVGPIVTFTLDDPPAGVNGVRVIGTEGGTEFTRAIIGDELEMDIAKCEADLVAAARELVERHAEVGAIVMECTNMPPFQAAVQRAVGNGPFSA